jgi:hypothetical protein
MVFFPLVTNKLPSFGVIAIFIGISYRKVETAGPLADNVGDSLHKGWGKEIGKEEGESF